MNPPDVRAIAAQVLADRDGASLKRTRRIVDPIDATRVRFEGRTLVNFSGNDYLGLAHHPRVLAAARGAIGRQLGSGAAALVTGRTTPHAAAERAIAAWKGVDDAVLLPSGYQANLAAIQTMAALAHASGRTPRFLIDKLAHASLIDAIRSTSAELRIFPHNGMAKLARLLDDADAARLDVVVTESIFSMDGDAADLAAIVALKSRATFALVVDEAHATGIYGDDGAGLVGALRLTDAVDLGIATFSKAAGAIGGAVYGPASMIEAVVNLGRAYVYTTSPPPLVADAIAASIDVMRTDTERRSRLRGNIRRLRDGIATLGLETIAGDSPIVPVILGDAARTLDASRELLDGCFLVIAVRPPTVPRGTSRLRLTVSSEHTSEQIDALLMAIRKLDWRAAVPAAAGTEGAPPGVTE